MHRNHARLAPVLFVLLIALQFLVTGNRIARADWLFSYPTNQVNIDSGKRNNTFYAGDPVNFTLSISNYGTYALQGGIRYEVRDYWGAVVAQGTVAAPTPWAFPSFTVPVTQPGWYKLYLHQGTAQAPWGDSVGGTMFVIFRPNANFPVMPSVTLPNNSAVFDGDEVARGVTGMGPQRHPVADASQPDQAIAQLDPSIAQDKQYYTPFDPQRSRPLMIAFPNGVADPDPAKQAKNLAGLRQIVAHYHNDVKYWEPKNEPNYTYSGADFVNKELKPFYQTIKSVDPSCKVLGPGVVTIGPYGLAWIEDFLKAGGANYIDAFSFHAYNNVNGDLTLARQSLDALNVLLARYGLANIEKWQTEQGYFAACYGAYEPRLEGRWTMLQMMVYEQYGIPKEHNHLWYDVSHGFFDFPAFWENADGPYSVGSFNPAPALMRVWSEELYGTNFAKAYDFGALGSKQYVGSLFSGPGKQVAAFMSAGRTDGKVTLNVSGGISLHVVSAFGVAQDLPVAAGVVTLPVPELPVYVEMTPGQSIQVVPVDYGPDLALTPGTTASASGTGVSPLDPSYPNSTSKIINGVLENWYWSQGPGDHPWMDNTVGFPAWVQVSLPQPAKISHVVVYAGVPWQADGSLLDYELQYDRNGQWVTIEHVQEPSAVVKNFTSSTFTTADSFYSDRCLFEHDFAPVTTSKIRLLVHDTTWGGGATQDIVTAGGQTGPHQITLREIEVYGDGTTPITPPVTAPTSQATGKVRFFPRSGCAPRMVGGQFQGSTDGLTYTTLATLTASPTEGQWTEAAFAADPKAFRFLRYLSPDGGWGNVSEVEFYTVTATSATKLTGTPFGTPGSYNNAGATFAKVFDGDTSTCFDAPGPNGNFAGLDQGGTAAPVPVPAPTPTVTSVSVSPSTATVGGGQAQPFTATVSGTNNPAQTVTWSASAGLVTSAGLFTAPAAAAGAQTVTITATSTVDSTKAASATVTVPALVPTVTSVSISPSTTTVGGGQAQQFSAMVSGTNAPAQTVTWASSAGVINGSGLFTAPAATAEMQTVTVTATSSLDGTKSASAIVTVPALVPTVASVSVSPSTLTITGGQMQQFTAIVTGTNAPAQTVTWSASAGSISSAGLFTAPAAIASVQTITVTATSTADKTKTASATVTVPALVPTVTSVSVSPSTTTVGGGQAQPFTATVNGTNNPVQTVTWSASAGSITGAGLFTAPTATASVQMVTVTATSTVDSTKKASATVTVPALPLAPQATGKVRFFPRSGCAPRMVGGQFQGSTDGLAYTTLATLTASPAEGQWTEAAFAADPKAFRFLRYLSPDGGWGNVSEVEFYTVTATSATKLTGTPFGTPGSYNNAGATFAKVFDGDTSTCFDAPGPNGNFAGLDQGGTAAPVPVPAPTPTVTSVSISPSTATVGGGQVQPFTATVSGTNNPAQTVTWSASAGLVTSAGLFTAPAATTNAQAITITATSTVDSTKAASATVTVPALVPTVTSVSVSPSTITLTGGQMQQFSATVSGTNTPAQTVTWSALAGSINGFGLFTAPAATGSVQTITVTATSTVDSTKKASATVTIPALITAPTAQATGKVRFFPRTTCSSRMRGGRFQGSTDGVTYADLFTVTSIPTEGQWTEAAFAADPKAFRFLRYLSPDGGWGNVSEVEFYTVTATSAIKLTGTPFGTPGSYNNAGATFAKVFDGDTSTCFDAPGPNGNFAGLDQDAGH